MSIDDFMHFLEGVKRSPRGWKARCPAHKDKSPSLSIREAEDGRILVHCFAGCEVHEICAALGLGVRDLYPDGPRDSEQIYAAKQQRVRREQAQHTVRLLQDAQGVLQREAEAVIRASSSIQLEQISTHQLDTYLNAIGEAHSVLRLEMGEEDYAEWSCCLGGHHRAVANG